MKGRYEPEKGIRQTYFSLRLALTLLVVMLTLALFIHAIPTWCMLHSVSAYYFTPLQAMFVGTLVAIGICLIVYQGTSYFENLALDIAGFMAFIVAFVPTAAPYDCEGNSACESSVVKIGATQAAIVENNVVPLLIVSLIATLTVFAKRLFDESPDGKELLRLALGMVAQLLILGAFLFLRQPFEKMAHGVAAGTLFFFIILVVIANHLGRRKDPAYKDKPWRRNVYAGIACLMLVTLAICLWLHVDREWPHWIIGAELALIAQFALFWGIQTADLQGWANREEKVDKQTLPEVIDPNDPAADAPVI